MNKNVQKVLDDNLCSSCGVCAANCPKNCVGFNLKNGVNTLEIDNNACVNCGICMKVCPINQINDYDKEKNTVEEYLLGDYKKIVCAKSKNKALLDNATSGGAVTQLVLALLNDEEYDCAFMVSDYCYDEPIKTKEFRKGDSLEKTQKSRYLTVSHENTVRYMLKNPKEKLIIIGTGCALQGIINTINLKKLNRDNYFLIGLFCDKTMSYGVIDYFKEHPVNKSRTISEFYFRSKAAGGWPGNVLIRYSDGSSEELPNTERMKVKEYFMPERCLYCLDKLNRNSDIAVGDNYVRDNSDKEGVSSCIIRTQRGSDVWENYKGLFEWHEDTADDIKKSQHLSQKKNNYYNACIKGLYPMCDEARKAGKKYNASLEKIKTGKSENLYKDVNRDIKVRRYKGKLKKLISLPVRLVKR